jgi:UDP-N-acetylglucosamine 2-epimerase
LTIVTILGARPQFVKAAPVSACLREAGLTELLIHTGQHYDPQMSQVFFDEMGLPAPHRNLEIGSGSHGWQTGQMLIRLEEILLAERPDRVLVYGDTNSTLAGALAAAKLQIPIAHVEAGLRSFNRSMPEEHNRVLTDHSADLLFCPTPTAVEHLRQERITQGVHLVGDTMYDAVLHFSERAAQRSTLLRDLKLEPKQYCLATIHRPYNTDSPEVLRQILDALGEIGKPVVLPVHPRTRAKLQAAGWTPPPLGERFGLRLIDPVGYLDMLQLERHAQLILTDSGGVQKEAFFFAVPCLTLRPETEWVETVESGWNVLVDTDPASILAGVQALRNKSGTPPPLFGDGQAAQKIVRILAEAGA